MNLVLSVSIISYRSNCFFFNKIRVKDEITQQSDLASVVAEPKCMVCADGMFPHQTDDCIII